MARLNSIGARFGRHAVNNVALMAGLSHPIANPARTIAAHLFGDFIGFTAVLLVLDFGFKVPISATIFLCVWWSGAK